MEYQEIIEHISLKEFKNVTPKNSKELFDIVRDFFIIAVSSAETLGEAVAVLYNDTLDGRQAYEVPSELRGFVKEITNNHKALVDTLDKYQDVLIDKLI
jgi:hypothetical protein